MNATRIKKAGKAVAGSALLVGATLTGAAGLAAAQDSGSSGEDSGDLSLADYPTPFIGEDGTVNTAIVVGEQAATIDVVGAINIAGSLGNQAFTTEQVSAEGGSFGFSASQGVTLDTQNDNLYYGDTLTEVRDTLTDDDLGVLQTYDFSDDSGDDTEVESFINVGSQPVTYGSDADGIEDDEDPRLYVPVPSEGDVGPGSDSATINGQDVQQDNYLLNMQANFEDGLDFTDEDVAGEDIELFGTTYTIAEDNDVADDEQREELVLYGASETVTASTGDDSSVTTTIGGDEVTLSVDAVTESDIAAISVNGELEEYDEDEEFTVNDQTVRVDNIIQTRSDESQGTVQFSIGSEELRLQSGQQVEDGDNDEIEGTHVEFNGNPDLDNINPDDSGGTAVSSIDIYVGAQDDDNDYVAAGESFEHEFFDQASFRFGGLNPDAASSEAATEVSVETNGDTEAQISFTADSGDSLTQDFIHEGDSDADGDLDGELLADGDGDNIVVAEDRFADEDDYITVDAGDFSHMFEVTSIDYDDGTPTDTTVDVTDVATGESYELELDQNPESDDNDRVAGTEIIDGQTYYVAVSEDKGSDGSTPAVEMSWGDGAYLDLRTDGKETTNTGGGGGITSSEFDGYNSANPPGETSIYTAVDTQNGGAVAFTKPVSFSVYSLGNPEVFELPSTESTDAQRAEFNLNGGTLEVTQDGTTTTYTPDADGHEVNNVPITLSNSASASDVEVVEVPIGGVIYDFYLDDDGGNNFDSLEGVAIDADQDVDVDGEQSSDTGDIGTSLAADDSSGSGSVTSPAAVFMQPENEDDEENAFVLTPDGQDSDDGYSFSGSSARAYTGDEINVQALEGTDDDVEAGYNEYGTYVRQDTEEEEGSVSLMLPTGQSVAGAAVTTGEGSLEMGGGSGSVESQTPTGFGQEALLDSEVTSSQRQNTNHILVGGPAVNDLVSTLVDQGEADVPRAGASPPGVTPADGGATDGNATDGNATDGGATEGSVETYGEGDAAIQLVEDSFADGANSLIVAGFTGEDTRQAANRLANADENPLPGQDRFTVETGQ